MKKILLVFLFVVFAAFFGVAESIAGTGFYVKVKNNSDFPIKVHVYDSKDWYPNNLSDNVVVKAKSVSDDLYTEAKKDAYGYIVYALEKEGNLSKEASKQVDVLYYAASTLSYIHTLSKAYVGILDKNVSDFKAKSDFKCSIFDFGYAKDDVEHYWKDWNQCGIDVYTTPAGSINNLSWEHSGDQYVITIDYDMPKTKQ